jgi:hypothetical protein
MDLTRAALQLQKIQRDLVAAHGHYITIHYKPTTTGQSPTYDEFFKESTFPLTPETSGGVTVTTGVARVVPGIIYHNPGSMVDKDGTVIMPIGRFEPDSVIFTCLLEDVLVSGVSLLDNSKYVVLSTDSSHRYQVTGQQKDGLLNPFVLHVYLGHSTVDI